MFIFSLLGELERLGEISPCGQNDRNVIERWFAGLFTAY
jgi:hypothetical protein